MLTLINIMLFLKLSKKIAQIFHKIFLLSVKIFSSNVFKKILTKDHFLVIYLNIIGLIVYSRIELGLNQETLHSLKFPIKINRMIVKF